MIPGEFVWFPERGWGVREPTEAERFEYRESYFERFKEISETPVGRALNRARVEFVERHWQGPVVDIGVGSGAFLEAWGFERGQGWDVAPAPLRWLEERGLLRDPFAAPFPVATAFDAIEHMTEPDLRSLLGQVTHRIFLSTPIYESAEAALSSKHYKVGEHLMFFREDGLLRFMRSAGFALLERSRDEERFGREGISTYAFYRAAP